MTRPEMLEIMRLLSALETFALSSGKPVPDFLVDGITHAVDVLERDILRPGGDEP